MSIHLVEWLKGHLQLKQPEKYKLLAEYIEKIIITDKQQKQKVDKISEALEKLCLYPSQRQHQQLLAQYIHDFLTASLPSNGTSSNFTSVQPVISVQPVEQKVESIKIATTPNGWFECPFDHHITPQPKMYQHLITVHPHQMKGWIMRGNYLIRDTTAQAQPSPQPQQPPPSLQQQPRPRPQLQQLSPPESSLNIPISQRIGVIWPAEISTFNNSLPEGMAKERYQQLIEAAKRVVQGDPVAEKDLINALKGTASEREVVLNEVVPRVETLISSKRGILLLLQVFECATARRLSEVYKQMQGHIADMAFDERYVLVLACLENAEQEDQKFIVDELLPRAIDMTRNHYAVRVFVAILKETTLDQKKDFIEVIVDNASSLILDDNGCILLDYLIQQSKHGELERARSKIVRRLCNNHDVLPIIQNINGALVIDQILKASTMQERSMLVDEICGLEIKAVPAVVQLLANAELAFLVQTILEVANPQEQEIVRRLIRPYADQVQPYIVNEDLLLLLKLATIETEVSSYRHTTTPKASNGNGNSMVMAFDDLEDSTVWPSDYEESRYDVVHASSKPDRTERRYANVTIVANAYDDDDNNDLSDDEWQRQYINLDPAPEHLQRELNEDIEWFVHEYDTQDFFQPEWDETKVVTDEMDTESFAQIMNLKLNESGAYEWQKNNVCEVLETPDGQWQLATVTRVSVDKTKVEVFLTTAQRSVIVLVPNIRPALRPFDSETSTKATGSIANATSNFRAGGRSNNNHRR